jgi:hypothetical protein
MIPLECWTWYLYWCPRVLSDNDGWSIAQLHMGHGLSVSIVSILWVILIVVTGLPLVSWILEWEVLAFLLVQVWEFWKTFDYSCGLPLHLFYVIFQSFGVRDPNYWCIFYYYYAYSVGADVLGFVEEIEGRLVNIFECVVDETQNWVGFVEL